MTGKESAHISSENSQDNLVEMTGAVSLNGTETTPASPPPPPPQIPSPSPTPSFHVTIITYNIGKKCCINKLLYFKFLLF